MTVRTLVEVSPSTLQAMAPDGAEIEIDTRLSRAYLRVGPTTFVAELEVEK